MYSMANATRTVAKLDLDICRFRERHGSMARVLDRPPPRDEPDILGGALRVGVLRPDGSSSTCGATYPIQCR